MTGRLATAFATALLGAALAGCGDTTRRTEPLVERTVGTGSHQVWVFQQKGLAPKSVVVFLHGLGGAAEDTPVNHLPWLRHLARRGSMVIYPRYERYPGDPLAPRYLLETMSGLAQSTNLGEQPLLLLGYSRGGGLAVTYSTVASIAGLEPRIVVGLYPAINDRQLDPGGTAPSTRFVFLVGDQDEVVAGRGADALRRWLLANGYPRRLVSVQQIRSTAEFTATHLSALENTPGARAALWEPVDQLIEEIRKPS